jgi:hypothetical protein
VEKYEYRKIYQLTLTDGTTSLSAAYADGSRITLDDATPLAALGRSGNEGWELVSVTHRPLPQGGDVQEWWLKRGTSARGA